MFENIKEFSAWLSEVTDYSDLIPLLLLLCVKNKKNRFSHLTPYFTILFIIKMITIFMADRGINNMALYHLMSVIELVFLTLFYSNILRFRKRVILLILIPALSFEIFSSFYLQSLSEWNIYSQTLNNLLFMFLGLYYYYHLYLNEEDVPVFRSPIFFISTSFLLYFTATFFLYSTGDFFLSEDKNGIGFFDSAWLIASISNIIKNIMISIGVILFLKNSKKQKRSNSKSPPH